MTRAVDEPSSTGPSRSTKGRGRAPAQQEPGNAIESSSLRPVELPTQQTQTQAPTPAELRPAPAETQATPAETETSDLHEEIARAAYYRAEQRGFAPGFELDDWLEAERALREKEGGMDLR